MPPQQTVSDLLALPPANDIADLAARLTALEAALPANDGVAWFTRIYIRVNDAVRTSTAAGLFDDPGFIERLDVRFVNLFFDALRLGWSDPSAAPRAWAPFLRARQNTAIAPIQFALAGMNAHIDRDLPVGLVATALERKLKLSRDSAQYRDFERVNTVLQQVERDVKAWFDTGFAGVIDREFGRVDDVIAGWGMADARYFAWTHGETLQVLQTLPTAADAFLASIDSIVGLASRALLIPTG